MSIHKKAFSALVTLKSKILMSIRKKLEALIYHYLSKLVG